MQNIRGETGNLKTLEVWKARKGMESVEVSRELVEKRKLKFEE